MTYNEFAELPWKERQAYDKKLKKESAVHTKHMIEKIHALNPIETESFKTMLIEKIELCKQLDIDETCLSEKIEQFIAESLGMKKTFVVNDYLAIGITYDEYDQMAPTVMFKDILDAV